MKNIHYRFLLMSVVLIISHFSSFGQIPPPWGLPMTNNFDFEQGTLFNWNPTYRPTMVCCPLSTTIAGVNVGSWTSHQIMTPADGLDPIGAFSIVPAGAGNNVLRLGSIGDGGEAQRVQYILAVPSTGANQYSVLYRYAVVLQDDLGVSHPDPDDRPRFEVSAKSLSTGVPIACAQATYVAGVVPGFTPAAFGGYQYLTWRTGLINLGANSGENVVIDFATSGCDATAHSGYAYLDLSGGINATTVGACIGGTFSMSAPSGFQNYTWYSPGFGPVIGTTESVGPFTSPSTTSVYPVVLQPFPGFGCIDTMYITVVPYTPTIPPLSMCVTSTATMSATPAGGTWTGGSGIAGISGVGVVTSGSSAGTSTVTYTDNAGCSANSVVSVIANPSITGPSAVCLYDQITLSGGPGAGTWGSSDPSVASVDPSGIVTGNSTPTGGGAGTATISFTTIGPPSCLGTKVVSVNPLPTITHGDPNLCVGHCLTLTGTTGGGTWNTSSPFVTVGLTTGIVCCTSAPISPSPATVFITYTLPTGCDQVFPISIYDGTPRIDGDPRICLGESTTLSNDLSGTWSSSDPSVATIGSSTGIVTTLDDGYTTITFTPNHCDPITIVLTVDPLPNITGLSTVCETYSITLSEATGGGTWGFTGAPFASIAVVDAHTSVVTGLVTGAFPGTAFVTYTYPTGCSSVHKIDVYPNPVFGDSPPAQQVCVGLTRCFVAAPFPSPLGTWTSSASGIASVVPPGTGTFGCFLGVSPGVIPITFTAPTTCFVVGTLTVNPNPAPVVGPSTLCVGSTTTYTSGPSGGTWGYNGYAGWPHPVGFLNLDVTSGIAVGNHAGVANVTYTLPTGCIATANTTVLPIPDPIIGLNQVCKGSTISLYNATPGAIWSSSNTSVADFITGGILSGIDVGTTTVSYTFPATGCARTHVVSVDPLPDPVGSVPLVCVGSTTTLTNTPTGGTWSTADVALLTVDPTTGVMTGVAIGSATMTYTLPTGCSVVFPVTVDDLPVVAAITGPDFVCAGSTITLASTPLGGTWSTPYTIAASVDASGVVTGLLDYHIPVPVKYTVTNACGSTIVSKNIVVGPPFVKPIMGETTICIGHTTTMSAGSAGGSGGGTWTCSPAAVATINPTTGVLTGMSAGTADITYEVTNSCGTTTVTANITITNMSVFITADFTGACTIMDDPPYLVDGAPCIFTCANVSMNYNINAPAGSTVTWTVSGGTLLSALGTSASINWPTPGGSGTITAHVVLGDCEADATMCVRVKETPTANFTTSTSSICLGGAVSFTDASTSFVPETPITGWHWDFGDGSILEVQNPTHVFTAPGHYDVSLTVKNSCGCASQVTMPIDVNPTVGPDIQCPSIVCEDNTATYTTSEPCGDYNWDVTGGTITSGAYTSSITVKWDNPDATGYGSVSLFVPCAPCPETTTIKVPVILDNAVIDGPSTICVGTQVRYQLPLWAATDYHWEALLSTGAGGVAPHTTKKDYFVTVFYTAPGVYRLRCTYQNQIGLCGGDVFKTITVLPAETISGPTDVCLGDAPVYNLTGGSAGNWELVDPTGAVEATSAAASIVFGTSPMGAGAYTVKSTGSFCADPLAVKVSSPVPAVDNLTGPGTVCLGHLYTYKAGSPVAGTNFEWTITGGILSSTAGDEVTVQWNAAGTKELRVRRKGTVAPFCTGPQYILPVTEESYSAAVVGTYTACPNSYSNFSNAYTNGDEYRWRIVPETAGSIVSGDYTPAIRVLWNNVFSGSTAQVVLEVTKCDVTVSNAVTIHMTSIPLTLSGPGTVCPNEAVTFTATPGAAGYIWNFGDGSPSVTYGNTISHVFSAPGGVMNIVTVATIAGSPDIYGCQPVGTEMLPVFVRSVPSAFVSLGGCPVPVLTATFSATPPLVGYQWYLNDVLIPGATDATHTATAAGWYKIIGTATNGCTTMDSLKFAGCGSAGGGTPCPDPVTSVAPVVMCNTIQLSGGSPSLATVGWKWDVQPSSYSGFVNGTPSVYSNTASATYSKPGIYTFSLGYLGCTDFVHTVTATIPAVVNFHIQGTCMPGGVSVDFMDYTQILPGYTITNIEWWDITSGTPGTYLGSGLTGNVFFPFGPPRTIREKVTYTDDPFTTYSVTCSADREIELPVPPVVTYTLAATPTCEGIPITFTPVTSSPGIVAYDWDFNDGATSLLPNTERTYTWQTGGDPNNFWPTLTVRDVNGCTASYTLPTSTPIEIYRNTLDGYANPMSVCANALPASLTFNFTGTLWGALSYDWYKDGTPATVGSGNTLSVMESGNYRVLVKDGWGCQKMLPTPSTQVNVIQMPPAIFTGRTQYCDGESIELTAAPWSGALYTWERDGNTIAGPLAPVSSISEMMAAGVYTYQLTTQVNDAFGGPPCVETSVPVPVIVEPIPAPPVITGPTAINCSNYQLQLDATAAQPGTFVWSNGVTTSLNDIYQGGLYQVWFKSTGGCVSSATTSVPMSPQHHFQYFPSGCYDICSQRFPLTINGAFKFDGAWEWLMNGSAVLAGASPISMPDFGIPGPGRYQWTLDNYLCQATSDPMDVTGANCGPCSLGLQAKLDCNNTIMTNTYYINVSFNNPFPGAGFTLGTNIGPITPFTGTTSSSSVESLNLMFTTTDPGASTVTVQIEYVDPSSGTRCYEEVTVPQPSPCPWPAMKAGAASDSSKVIKDQSVMTRVSNSMLVFPNPASNELTVSYDYGALPYAVKGITVFNALGSKVANTVVNNATGSWKVNVDGWSPGIYMIRMEGDGAALQTQRVVVVPQ